MPSHRVRMANASETFLDPRIGQQRQRVDLRAHKGRGQCEHCQDDKDLRHEGERDFLDLRQCLKERNADTRQHRGSYCRARGNDNRPDSLIDDIEGVCLIHLADNDAGSDRKLRSPFECRYHAVAVDAYRFDDTTDRAVGTGDGPTDNTISL